MADISTAMFNQTAAECYQQTSNRQRGYGIQVIQNNINAGHGATILDLGCGTGELSTYLAELAGQNGKVIAVDPDVNRIKVAQESHKEVKNLSFVEGSTSNFPGMGSETYDIIYSNAVFHWVADKKEAFKNMFSSLKPAGKIVVHYCDHLLSVYDRAYRELNPENLDRLLNMWHCETRPVIEEMCTAAGFHILKSYHYKAKDLAYVFENGESLRSFFWATTHGIFDPELVTEDRLASFCARYSSGEAGEMKLYLTENDFYSVLVAIKPAKATK